MGGGAAASRVSSAMAVAVAAAAALVVMWAGTATAAAAVYEVGDKTGWTILGNPNYTAWAASKKFHLGDTVGTYVSWRVYPSRSRVLRSSCCIPAFYLLRNISANDTRL